MQQCKLLGNYILLTAFDPTSEPTSLSQRWKAWRRRFETYLVAINLTENARTLYPYQAEEAWQEIVVTLADTGEDNTCKTSIKNLTSTLHQ